MCLRRNDALQDASPILTQKLPSQSNRRFLDCGFLCIYTKFQSANLCEIHVVRKIPKV